MLSTKDKQKIVKRKLGLVGDIAINLHDTVDYDMTTVASSTNTDLAAAAAAAAVDVMPDAIPNYRAPVKWSTKRPLYICIYQMVMNENQPILLYLLHNSITHLGLIKFPSGCVDTNTNTNGMLRDVIQYVKTILPKGSITYMGYDELTTHNVVILKYMNYNLSECMKPIPISNNYIWSLPFEIMNTRHVFNIPMSITALNFFLKNADMLVLKERDNIGFVYANPVIGYYKIKTPAHKKVELVDIYLEQRNKAIKKCYYFYRDVPDKNDDETVIRVALFLGRTGLVALLPSEPLKIDYARIDTLIDNTCTTTENNKLYLIMDYAQHMPLSYH